MADREAQQLFFMRRAIRLGARGRLTAPPNPWVGCIIVKEGDVIGEGYHVAPGHPHAEIVALQQAKGAAKGATAYVSLEPCPHQGRTPSCVDALIEAGIREVIIPFTDPDHRVSGQGVKILQKKGVEVRIGVGKKEAKESLLPYLHHRYTYTPFCLLKAAVSIDGRMAAQDGTSKWITSVKARSNVQLLRAQSQAILVGSNTALLDQPQLTVRGQVDQPLRVLIDSQGKVPPEGPLFDPSLAQTLVFTSHKKWEKKGIEILELPKIDLQVVLKELGQRGIIQLLIEGGATLHSVFLKERQAHRCALYIGNCLLGSCGQPFASTLNVSTMQEAPSWKLEKVYRFGSSIRLDYLIQETISIS
ncbi:MAG: bifunctional diaminohydroxyphosphoribosylaminopyrimidine deaminase/5-amino-6-(5-phosphoribosylamino)uracil reductase RibD [Chlamydiales bacterium]